MRCPVPHTHPELPIGVLDSRLQMGQPALMSDDLPSATEVAARLVDDLADEGDQGLWEVVWSLNSDSSPSSPEKVALARQVVFALLREGRLTLRTAPWPKSADEGRALTDDEFALLADTDTPWFDPENVGEFIVWITMA
jgi:hypothetical protein